WPLVRAARPDATLTIVGRADHGFAADCRRAPGVVLTGWVDDVDPYVQRSRALIVPMLAGSGPRGKILQARSRGVPVVSTTVGCEGIAAIPGVHLLVADDPRALADAVLRVLADDALAASMARAARALAVSRYDVDVVAGDVLDAIRSMRPS